MIRCADVDTAVAYRLIVDQQAFELAVSLAKANREYDDLVNKVDNGAMELHKAFGLERVQYNNSMNERIKERDAALMDVQRIRPWATIGKVAVGFGVLFGGAAIYNSIR